MPFFISLRPWIVAADKAATVGELASCDVQQLQFKVRKPRETRHAWLAVRAYDEDGYFDVHRKTRLICQVDKGNVDMILPHGQELGPTLAIETCSPTAAPTAEPTPAPTSLPTPVPTA